MSAHDVDVVMPMHNLIGYCDNISVEINQL